MRIHKQSCISFLFLLWAPLFFSAWATADDGQDGILVGRIAHVEGGNLLRYVPESKDWVATVKDAPFGLEDALYAESGAKAECIMPNGIWIRIGGNSQMQMIALDSGSATIDLASGLTRMYDKNPGVVIKATTPFGYVVAREGAVFDLYVGDESMELIAVRGGVDFVHEATGSRYSVREGDASLLADSRDVGRGDGTVDAAWDDWNGQRDALWATRLNGQGRDAEYLPEPIRDESYVLEENGEWEQVYYEGDSYTMWRPTSVASGWSPFTEGRWTVYYDDNCWIPTEPFGYVTHHYGSWIWIDPFKRWYWLPPVTRGSAAASRLFLAFGWYPGRVGWLHGKSAIGWVPLAPYEDYYSHRPWGRRAVVIGQRPIVNIDISKYLYLDRAIVIPSDRLYHGNRYTPFIQRFGRTTILNSYQSTTVIDKTALNTYDTDARRFAFNDAKVERKPHAAVLGRINDNRRATQNTGNSGGRQILQNLGMATAAPLSAAATIQEPVLSDRMVAASQVSRSVRSVSFPKREMKPKEGQRQPNVSPAQTPGQRGQVRPATSGQNDSQPRARVIKDAREQVMQNRATTSPVRETASPSPDRRPALRNREPNSQENRMPLSQENERQIRSPRQTPVREQTSPSLPQRQQPRQQEAIRQTEPQRQQQQETQRQQQEESQRRQQQEIQQRQQTQQQALREMQRWQQEESQRRQQQEMQQRQQAQQQAQQEMQRRQQQESQRRQQQEMQQRQQAQQRTQQDMQRRQQQESQRRQQQEMQQRQQAQQRTQQDMQRRQQQEMQQRQQAQQRTQQEMQQRQQAQQRAQQERQRSQQEDDQKQKRDQRP